MKAGRELDALIAEKVFGWERHRDGIFGQLRYHTDRDEPQPVDCPAFSTDIAAAWLVAEKCGITVTPGIKGWMASHCNAAGSGERTWVGMTNYRDWVKAKTAPLAICLAAIQAY